MSSVEELEAKLAKSEKHRKLKEDMPKTLEALEKFREIYADLLEANAFQRISKLLDMGATVENLMNDIAVMRNKLVTVMENTNNVASNVQALLDEVNRKLASLEKRLDDEQRKNDELRELETQTLQNINDYLKNWS